MTMRPTPGPNLGEIARGALLLIALIAAEWFNAAQRTLEAF